MVHNFATLLLLTTLSSPFFVKLGHKKENLRDGQSGLFIGHMAPDSLCCEISVKGMKDNYTTAAAVFSDLPHIYAAVFSCLIN